ncbi:hypothetical protein [Rhodoplanes sp. Z2-YC6860]|uniref:hypothetical protein n=1 Tax=Rhodoplanes sp. Z2-YC6860 TaxID=674703 RepID=UPI00082AA133|nr:hypothetical protein [Rhodoplanes sp. Z2-YC6860]
MKALSILPAATAAILALSVSVASSQEVCLKGYQACMDTCASKVQAQMQDACFQNCQTNNNMCSDRVFGSRNGAVVNVPATAAAPPAQAKDAMAKDATAKKEPRTSAREAKKLQKKDDAPAPAAEQPKKDAAPSK